MTNRKAGSIMLAAAALVVFTPIAGAELVGRYYTLPNAMEGHLRHVDVQRGVDGDRVPGLVERRLGPSGLPVATTYAMTRSGGSGPIQDRNEDNEILWWKPGRAGDKEVMVEKSQTDPASLNIATNFFMDGHASNAQGFRAVRWERSIVLEPGQTGTLSMALMADDDAWVFVNGELALDHGGVKALISAMPVFNTVPLNEGVNRIDIFYADRFAVQAGIVFQSAFQIVPAPGCLAGLMGLVAAAGRRRRR